MLQKMQLPVVMDAIEALIQARPISGCASTEEGKKAGTERGGRESEEQGGRLEEEAETKNFLHPVEDTDSKGFFLNPKRWSRLPNIQRS